MIDESEANIFISGLRPTRWHWVTEHRNKPLQSRTDQLHQVPPVPESRDMYVVRMFERRCVCLCSVGKPEGKGTLARPNHRWNDNTKMDLK